MARADSVAIYEPDGTLAGGQPVSELAGELGAAFARVAASGRAETIELDEAGQSVRAHLYRIGERVHVVATDITAQRQAEQRAELSRTRALALSTASRQFGGVLRDTRSVLVLLARNAATSLGEIAVANVISADRTSVEPVVAVADSELERDVQALLSTGTPFAGSLTERIATTRAPLRLGAVEPDAFAASLRPEFRATAIRLAPKSFMIVPIEVAGRVIGTLAVSRTVAPDVYTDDDQRFIEELVVRAALALENARVIEAERAARRAAERNAEHTRRLQAVAAQLSHRKSAREVAETVLREMTAVIGASTAAVWLLDETGTTLDMLAHHGYEHWDRHARIPLDAPAPVCAAVLERIPVYIASVAEYRDRFPASVARIQTGVPTEFATACVALVTEGRAIGVFALSFMQAHAFDADERRFLEVVADQCALAIDRSRLFEQERAANRAKDEFLAMLGHELRNPLAPITTALQLMRLRREDGHERELAVIERQTQHLSRLVDDLLDLSRITRGTLELRKMRVDLGAVIAQAVEMASPLLEQRGQHLTVSVPHGRMFVDGDEQRLVQVFQNLLINAAKYTQRGGSIVVDAKADGGHVIADVVDNGRGIRAELLPTIFDPFVQAPQTFDRAEGGLGIGLALVHRIVALHDGTVDARSDGPEKGSCFRVSLPLAATVEAQPGHVPVTMRTIGSARRILLVDDNRDGAEMLADLLRAAGHEVMVAFDGPSALDAVVTFAPDVAVLDIGLPVMDGYDLARRLRERLPSVPRLVALTGYGQEHDRLRSREAGFDMHLVKPVDSARVLAAIEDN